jgi:hypothetical protein
MAPNSIIDTIIYREKSSHYDCDPQALQNSGVLIYSVAQELVFASALLNKEG